MIELGVDLSELGEIIDAICIALYVIILGTLKTKDSMWVTIAFIVSVCYTSSSWFEIHPAWLNHVVISLIFIPILYFLSKPVCISIILYTIYHWLISGDYIYTTSETWLSMTFIYVSPTINLIIMTSLVYAGTNNKHRANLDLDAGWLPYFFSRKGYFKKMGSK